jgi:hypothetical protein
MIDSKNKHMRGILRFIREFILIGLLYGCNSCNANSNCEA